VFFFLRINPLGLDMVYWLSGLRCSYLLFSFQSRIHHEVFNSPRRPGLRALPPGMFRVDREFAGPFRFPWNAAGALTRLETRTHAPIGKDDGEDALTLNPNLFPRLADRIAARALPFSTGNCPTGTPGGCSFRSCLSVWCVFTPNL